MRPFPEEIAQLVRAPLERSVAFRHATYRDVKLSMSRLVQEGQLASNIDVVGFDLTEGCRVRKIAAGSR